MLNRIWCIPFSLKNECLGDFFSVPHDNTEETVKDLKKKIHSILGIDPAMDFEIWRSISTELRGDTMGPYDIQDIIEDIHFTDKALAVTRLDDSVHVCSLMLSKLEVLLVRLPLDTLSPEWLDDDNDDEIEYEDDVYERMKTAKFTSISPSKIIGMYPTLQNYRSQKLLDNRPVPDQDVPPISLLYYGFGHFLDITSGTDIQNLSNIDLKSLKMTVDEFVSHLCFNGNYTDPAVMEHIRCILSTWNGSRIPSLEQISDSGGHPKAHVIRGAHGGAACVIVFQDSASDIHPFPEVVVTSYAAQTHKHANSKNFADVFRGWRMPCLGITIACRETEPWSGCTFTFHAIVAVDHRYRVIPLTSGIFCTSCPSYDQDRQSLYAAFAAASVLLNCILEDSHDYSISPPPSILPEKRCFPAINQLKRYKADGIIRFRYIDIHPYRLSNNLLYVAKINGGGAILVKFTRSYSIELHDFCMARGHAPKILGFERLPGGWFAVAMECLVSFMPILVADDLQDHGHDWISQIENLVDEFHAAGFVHGDLREANILCADKLAVLIDFDWSGKDGEASYSQWEFCDLNPELLEGRAPGDRRMTIDSDNRVLNIALRKVRELLPVKDDSQSRSRSLEQV